MAITTHESRPFNVRQPFSRAEARAAGIRLRELLGPRFHKVLYDRYVLATVPITVQLRAETALSVSPAGTYISHHTAAVLWSGVVPEVSDVHVTVPDSEGRSRRDGVRAHRGTHRPGPQSVRGLPVSSPLQTFLDLASQLNLVDLVVLGDSLVKACRVSVTELVDGARAYDKPGFRRARRAARYVRDGVDSPMESRLRMLLVLAGLPEPRVNLILRAGDGSWRLRFDLCYEDVKLIVEYDGRQRAEDRQQWQRDIHRREELDSLGWRLIIITSQDFYSDPVHILQRVADALRDQGATGVPRRFRTEWIRYFAPSPKRHAPVG